MQIGPMVLRNQLQVKHEKVVGSRRVLHPPLPPPFAFHGSLLHFVLSHSEYPLEGNSSWENLDVL